MNALDRIEATHDRLHQLFGMLDCSCPLAPGDCAYCQERTHAELATMQADLARVRRVVEAVSAVIAARVRYEAQSGSWFVPGYAMSELEAAFADLEESP